MLIDVQGRPGDIAIEQSSGYPALDAAAIDAMKRSRLKPHVEGGRPRAAIAVVPFNFRLE